MELIGSIISEIGEENLRKYLWSEIINKIRNSEETLKLLQGYYKNALPGFLKDPFDKVYSNSYKTFLDALMDNAQALNKQKELMSVLKNLLQTTLYELTNDNVIASYFYEFISDTIGINKAWEGLTQGSIKSLKRKEADIIKYIVRLVRKQGYTHFFVFVDEFEDITVAGRLSKAQADNYMSNLRTLLDSQREWCTIFAMTRPALDKIKSYSPPLYERISAREIILDALNLSDALHVVKNYMSFGSKDDNLHPFTKNIIEYINKKADGNLRRFLRYLYILFERAASSKINEIDKKFVDDNISFDD